MRKGLFAIVLVAAAFAGGAAVNGPGLRWAKDFVWSKLPTDDEAEDPSDLVQPAVGPVATSDEAPPGPTNDEKEEASPKESPTDKASPKVSVRSAPGPTAPEPSALQSGGQAEASTVAKNSTVSGITNPRPDLDELPPLNVPKGKSEAPPELLPPRTEVAADAAAPATLPLSLEETPSNALASKADSSKPPMNVTDKSWGDAPGSAPAAAVAPRPFTKQPERDPAAAAVAALPGRAGSQASGDWSELRRKMRELGVTRYGIEGEPGGRVRFHCIIPLAGKRAVGQHFEAEGDDEVQAATSALRRVTLWRATESTMR